MNPAQTLFDVKRLIGRRFKDSTVQKDIKLLPFEIVDVAGKPQIKVKVNNDWKTMPPEEVSSMVLIKMKDFVASSWIFLCQRMKSVVLE